MPRKKKKYNLNTRITSALRRLWLYSPNRYEAVKRGRENGNICEMDGCNTFQDPLEVDHRIPVVPLNELERNWHEYILRLFCDSSMLINLCTPHHYAKTTIQREQRKQNRQKNKPKSKKSLTKKKK